MTDRRTRWLLALSGVLLIALALRGPFLQDVPHLTDETAEVLFARAIAVDGARPLTHTDAYNGPLWAYLLAATLTLFGPSSTLPRAFTLALGLATVAATFALGGRLARPGGRLGPAIVAGTLMATSFTHALVGGRVAWSNSSTPLWTTLCMLALLEAVRRRSGPRLVVAGGIGGLALHTHPSVAVFLAACSAWFVANPSRRAWCRTRWPWLAILAALAAYSPVVAYNLATGFRSFAEAGASTNSATPSLGGWLADVPAATAQLGRSMAGGFDLDGVTTRAPSVAIAWLYATAALAASIALARRGPAPGRRLPLSVAVSALVLLPLVNRNWDGFLEARYLAFALPPLYAAAGTVLGDVAGGPQPAGRRRVVALVVAAAVALPALRVASHVRSALNAGFDNRRLRAMTAVAASGVDAGAMVLVDDDLRNVAWRAGGHPRRAVEYLLAMDGIPFTRAPTSKINHFLAAGAPPLVLFLAGETADALGARHRLDPVDVAPRIGEEAWGLYTSGLEGAEAGSGRLSGVTPEPAIIGSPDVPRP